MPVHSDVITQPQPDTRPSIKAKITSRFPRFKRGEQTPREVLEEVVKAQKPELTEELPTPEETYRNTIEASRNENEDPFVTLKKAAEAGKAEMVTEKHRKFGPHDKLRHKALNAAAKMQSVDDIQQFQELVEFLEDTMTKGEYKTIDFSAEPTQEEKERLISVLSKKGYDVTLKDFHLSESKEGGYWVGFRKDVSENVTIKDIGALKSILSSGDKPVETLKALKDMGLHISSSCFDAQGQLPKLTELLKISNTPEALRFINGYSTLPHETYISISGHDEYREVNRLEDMIRTGSIRNYDDDFFDKAGTIARAFNIGISLNSLDFYKSIIDNPSEISFLAAVLKSDYISPWVNRNIVHEAHDLARLGILDDLTKCINSEIKIHPHSEDAFKDPNYLSVFLEAPGTKDFLQDKEKQDFARVAAKIIGGKIDINELDKMLDNRIEIIYSYKLLEKNGLIVSDNTVGEGEYHDSSLQALTTLVENQPVKEALIDPGFQQFLIDIKAHGITLPSIDFKSMRWNIRVPDVVRLYRAKPILDYVGDDAFDLIQATQSTNQQEAAVADRKISEYEKLADKKEFFDLLLKYGVQPTKQELEEGILDKMSASPLLREHILSQIPEGIKGGWVRGSLTLPDTLQVTFSLSHISGEGGAMVTPKAIQKFNELVDLFKNSEFVRVNSSVFKDTLLNYPGDIRELFHDGLPTKDFAMLVVSEKQQDQLIQLVDIPDFIKSLDGSLKDNLVTLRDAHHGLKGMILGDFSFPDIPPEELEKYHVVSQILGSSRFGYVSSEILRGDMNALKAAAIKWSWFSDDEYYSTAAFISNKSELFLQNVADVDFVSEIVETAGEHSLAILTNYEKYISRQLMSREDRPLFVDYAHIFKDPQSVRDPALRRGYRIMGDYLSFDSYKSLKEVMDGSASNETLQGLGITQKGEEGVTQLESTMRSFILGLGSSSSDLSLLDHKIYSDFLKSYVRYESSAWGNHSSDNFDRTIHTLQEIKESAPETLSSDLPSSGIQEIAKIEHAKTNDATFTDSFLSRYSTFTDNIQKSLDAISSPRAFSGIAGNIKIKIDEQVLALEEDLDKNKDKPQAQVHIQKRIDRLKTVNPSDLKSFQANFSALAQEKVFNDLLMQAVFTYTLQKFPEQRERMAQAISKGIPDTDSISTVLDFSEHMTTKEAWKSYFTDKNAKRAFQNILDTKEINDGLSRLMNEGGVSGNFAPVEFVPTRGVLMEFSGYIADACWASRYESSIKEFPNITTVVMQDLSKDVPKLLGSTLLIETTSNDGDSLLVIRGLNPLESFINHVDISDFYNKYTEYVKRIAGAKGRKAAIVIDNHSGGASTNRPLLYNFLSAKAGSLSRIGVSADDTTFNGYNITKDTYLLS